MGAPAVTLDAFLRVLALARWFAEYYRAAVLDLKRISADELFDARVAELAEFEDEARSL